MMKKFRTMALITTGAIYFSIFVGGLVRAAGAGLGCPDWPKCFGRWIPPFSIADLPAGIDPVSFNVTLAWIEYFNRLIGVSLGFLMVITALLAIKHFRNTPRVIYPALVGALLAGFQGWQGSVVVASELKPLIVTVHFVLALVIACLFIYATLQSYRASEKSRPAFDPAVSRTKRLVVFLGVIAILQILSGTQVRQALEAVAGAQPLWTADQYLPAIGGVDFFHMGFGFLLLAMMLYVGLTLLRSRNLGSRLTASLAAGLIAVVIFQIGSGLVLHAVGLPALIRLFHLWLAAITIGLIVILYVTVSVEDSSSVFPRWRLKPTLISLCTLVVLLAVLAYSVIEQAERSRAQGSVGFSQPNLLQG